jgi:CheY-like chemotaxis protein
MKIFFLDDNKERHISFKRSFPNAEIIFAETANEAIEILSKGLDYNLICIDHDLGNRIFVPSEDPNTGYQVAKFLKDKDIKCQIIIHSCNPDGAINIQSLLPKAELMPIFWLNNKYKW